MPCSGSYETSKERGKREYMRKTASLLVYVFGVMGKEVLANVKTTAAGKSCTDVTKTLCKELRTLKRKDLVMFEKVVYNPYSRTSRDLADWWEDHCAVHGAKKKNVDPNEMVRLVKRLESRWDAVKTIAAERMK